MCEDRVSTILEEIVAAVLARYDECAVPGFCRTGIVGGNVAWDDCCDCGAGEGQLWARLVEWIPDPAIPSTGPTGCDQPTTLIVGVGALRCVPTLDENGQAPTAAEEAEAAGKINLDAQLIRDAVMCSLPEREWVGWAPLGYEGGCGGGEHIFQVPFAGCACDESGSPGA
jgi:hypothetical protein